MSRLIGNWIRNGYESFERWRNYSNSRKQADGYRKRIAESKAHPFVTDRLIKRAKEEADARFGDPGHWHWLALYAEIREEYIEGWLPGDQYTYKFIPYLNPRRLAYLSTIKSYDHQIFGSFASEPVAVVVNGVYYNTAGKKLSPDRFLDLLHERAGEVVVKEDAAPSGKGIHFMEPSEINPDDFEPGKSYLVQPLFRQHPALAKLYPESVNTLRLSTYIGTDGQISVKHKLLRVGSGGRRIVNAGDNDIDIYIDENGRFTLGPVDGIGRLLSDRHPDTGILYEDFVVPSLREAMAACKKAHTLFPYLRYIAWDLYIDEEAIPRMIEWNAVNPSIWVHEARIGPLWSEEEIKEMMEWERRVR